MLLRKLLQSNVSLPVPFLLSLVVVYPHVQGQLSRVLEKVAHVRKRTRERAPIAALPEVEVVMSSKLMKRETTHGERATYGPGRCIGRCRRVLGEIPCNNPDLVSSREELFGDAEASDACADNDSVQWHLPFVTPLCSVSRSQSSGLVTRERCRTIVAARPPCTERVWSGQHP
jgi:hypothetical protein